MTLVTFFSAGTGLAQNTVTSSPISKGRDARLITPEAVLSLREPRELQISPDGKQVAFRVREPADPKLPRCGKGCFDSRRRVNSTLGPLESRMITKSEVNAAPPCRVSRFPIGVGG